MVHRSKLSSFLYISSLTNIYVVVHRRFHKYVNNSKIYSPPLKKIQFEIPSTKHITWYIFYNISSVITTSRLQTWLLTSFLCLYDLLQTTQRNGLSVECDRSWIRSLLAVVCFEPQILHVNILSSAVEWNFILCSTEPFMDLNALQHSPQNETYSVLWNVSWWLSHSFFELYAFVQILQNALGETMSWKSRKGCTWWSTLPSCLLLCSPIMKIYIAKTFRRKPLPYLFKTNQTQS